MFHEGIKIGHIECDRNDSGQIPSCYNYEINLPVEIRQKKKI